jgi:8-oxo-dGTP pyrophosphatase MutT (NUDIX family)
MAAESELPDREETSAGGVVLRSTGPVPEVALAEQIDRNSRSRTVRLPKGKPDPGESLEQTALREVLEETGLSAEITGSLGQVIYRYFEQDEGRHVNKRVHFFLMRCLGGDIGQRDGEMERVYWVPLHEAAQRVTFETEREILERAVSAVAAPSTREEPRL